MNAQTPASGNGCSVVPPTTALFQRAHSKIVTLQKIEDQLFALVEQRKRLQEELRDIQSQINAELDRIIQVAEERPATAFQSDVPPLRRPAMPKNAIHLEVAQAG